jgi:hypothetical protein
MARRLICHYIFNTDAMAIETATDESVVTAELDPVAIHGAAARLDTVPEIPGSIIYKLTEGMRMPESCMS